MGLIARPDVVAVLIDTEPLVLVEKLAPEQPAGILRDSPQPLIGRLIGRPLLDVLGRERGLLLILLLRFRALRILLVLSVALVLVLIGLLAVRFGVVLLLALVLLVLGVALLLAVLPLLLLGFGIVALLLVAAVGILLSLRLLVLILLLTLLLLLEQLLDEIPVIGRVLVAGIELERTVVGLDRGLELG